MHMQTARTRPRGERRGKKSANRSARLRGPSQGSRGPARANEQRDPRACGRWEEGVSLQCQRWRRGTVRKGGREGEGSGLQRARGNRTNRRNQRTTRGHSYRTQRMHSHPSHRMHPCMCANLHCVSSPVCVVGAVPAGPSAAAAAALLSALCSLQRPRPFPIAPLHAPAPTAGHTHGQSRLGGKGIHGALPSLCFVPLASYARCGCAAAAAAGASRDTPKDSR
jgi:hypothetical protein